MKRRLQRETELLPGQNILVSLELASMLAPSLASAAESRKWSNNYYVDPDLILIYFSPTLASNPWQPGANNIMTVGRISALKPQHPAWSSLKKAIDGLIYSAPTNESPSIPGVNWAIFAYRKGNLVRQISLRDEILPRAFDDDYLAYLGNTLVYFRARELVEALAAAAPLLGISRK